MGRATGVNEIPPVSPSGLGEDFGSPLEARRSDGNSTDKRRAPARARGLRALHREALGGAVNESANRGRAELEASDARRVPDSVFQKSCKARSQI